MFRQNIARQFHFFLVGFCARNKIEISYSSGSCLKYNKERDLFSSYFMSNVMFIFLFICIFVAIEVNFLLQF